MRLPMPSPNRTNYENLFVDHERLLPPVAAYDAINGNTSDLVPEDIGVIEKLIEMLRAKGFSDDECAEVRHMLDGGMSMDDFPARTRSNRSSHRITASPTRRPATTIGASPGQRASATSASVVPVLVLDRAPSARSYDLDGRLRVSAAPISKANVCRTRP